MRAAIDLLKKKRNEFGCLHLSKPETDLIFRWLESECKISEEQEQMVKELTEAVKSLDKGLK